MIVSTFVFFVISLVGLTFILVESKIAEGFRQWWRYHSNVKLFGHNLSEIIDCHQCTGFWVGAIGSPCLVMHMSLPFYWPAVILIPVWMAMCGFAISMLAVLTRALLDWLTLNIGISLGDMNEQETPEPSGDQTSDSD